MVRSNMKLSAVLRVVAVAATVLGPTASLAQQAQIPAALTERLEKEKEARKACKIEICKAFAKPEAGAPISCDVTKTWLKNEITGRFTGGSWVWGYGHVQCTVKLNLDRGEIAKSRGDGKSTATFGAHAFVCSVDDQDATKGKAFDVKVSITPVVTFEKGEAKSVALEPVSTEGSTVASAAVGSVMALDKVSGLVSSGASGEINDFLYSKCQADGVEIVKK